MRRLLWLLLLAPCVLPGDASAQATPNVWHPYQGGVNCIQVADGNGNFNCYPGITINPVTGVVGGLAGGGTVSSVTAGAGLTATPVNPVVGTGTIAMPNVGPGAGSSCGDSTHSCSITIDQQGRVSALTNNVISGGGGGGTPGGSNTQCQYNNAGSFGGVTGCTSNGTTITLVAPVLGTPASVTLTNATGLPLATGVTGTLQAAQEPAHTGDVTNTAGSLNMTLANSGVTAGSCGDTTHSCGLTIDAKGRITVQTNNVIAGGGGGNTTSTSLTSGTIPVANGANSIVNTSPALAISGSTLTFGSGSPTGALSIGSTIYTGTSSGAITMQPQPAAGTYNFNLPITAGTAGQVLTSQGGGSTAMTWTTLGGGSGTVTSSGTPTIHQTPVWTTATDIKGVGPGTSGQVLTSNGASSDPSYQSAPTPTAIVAIVTNSGNQSIPNATNTAVNFDTDTDNPQGMHNTVTNNSRITITSPGIYYFHAGVSWAASATGTRYIVLRINGTTSINQTNTYSTLVAGGFSEELSAVWRMATPGDYVECVVFQDSGGALDLVAGAPFPVLSAVKMGN